MGMKQVIASFVSLIQEPETYIIMMLFCKILQKRTVLKLLLTFVNLLLYIDQHNL